MYFFSNARRGLLTSVCPSAGEAGLDSKVKVMTRGLKSTALGEIEAVLSASGEGRLRARREETRPGIIV